MNEKQYQTKLIKKIRHLWPDCFVMKNDAATTQGLPDLLILGNNRWAMLEVKMDDDSPMQPNQSYYVERFHHMSFAAFINPGNEEVVLNDLQSALGLTGQACVP
jgi:hypothetical protein